ncbi:uncharacterized protein LOC135164494 [Diachasmimorpha longicaudata]|uniref:uncharacterized protein LOC135164494 n=1 Tax=Diachasmimorpha longicaudata TaxID=58733 RepID=UPI0030B87DF0
MASNDQWPPVAPVGKHSIKNRSTTNTKKPTKEIQQQVLSGLNEMFENTLESDVILSVANSCDWELDSCIDSLIVLSSTVESQNKASQEQGAFVLVSRDPGNQAEPSPQEIGADYLKMDKTELQKQKQELKKFEKIKKTSKNRMGSFRGNISKLDSNYREKLPSATFDSIWNPPMLQSKSDEKNWNDSDLMNNALFTLPQMSQSSNPWIQGPNIPHHPPSETNSIASQSKPKKESELCGLKVQYRTAGMENSSDDDDADVVIEEELNCTIPTSIPVNVSQLLSSSIQAPAQVATSYKTELTTTPSPPSTPKRSIHQATVDRIKRAILSGDKIMVLLRGLPGSGKSFLARSLVSTTTGDNPAKYIFSADDYFVALGRGIYMYDPKRLSDAHTITQNRAHEALSQGKTPVIIDNTNTQAWEMRPYAAMAVEFGYIVEVLEPDTPWANKIKELAQKNTHGVPKDKIEQMLMRFEPGVTGDKLLTMYSLWYAPGADPREVKIPERSRNAAEELSVSVEPSIAPAHITNHLGEPGEHEQPEEQTKTMEREDRAESPRNNEHKPSPGETYCLQVLPAIGSERKNSVVFTDVGVASDSVKEEMGHNDENVAHYSEMQEQDEEFGKKSKRNGESPGSESKGEENGVRSAVHNFLSELTQGYNSTSAGFQRAEQRQSTVIITELFEEQEIDNVADIAASLLEGTTMEDIDLCNENESAERDYSIFVKSCEHEVLMEDEKIENSSGEDKDMSFIDAENLSDIETAEESTEPQAQSTLGTIFNIIKTSILGNTQDEEQLTNNEVEEGKELKEFSLMEDVKISNDKSESVSVDDVNVFESPVAEIRAAIDSIDNDVLMEGTKRSDKNHDSEFYAVADETLKAIKMLSIEEANIFSAEFVDSKKIVDEMVEKNVVLPPADTSMKNPESVKSGEPAEESEIIDNVNRITWKESPFPVDDLLLPKVNPVEEANVHNVQKQDVSTNTSYYDFNVSYFGGTSEPIYRVISAFNRPINEAVPNPRPERPPVKLMLDKSSMTGDIFSREGNPEIDDDEAKKDRFPELMELFPHIPRDYLVEIYEKVNEDLDWAVELLLEGGTENIVLKTTEENSGSDEPSTVEQEDNNPSMMPEPVQSFSPNLRRSSQCLESDYLKNEGSEDTEREQERQKYAEFSINEDIMARTLEMKEPSADVSDDAASTSTASISRMESTEDEKSSESDDLVELNLGFDCIRGLEQTLGIQNFHIPENFSPVIQVKKSIAEELYANWIESFCQQANARHEQLDEMMAKDAELARSLERKMELEGATASENSSEPNLEQIMDMELALAKYKNELKSIISRETPDDLAARLSRQMLNEALPGLDPDAFNEILKVTNGNFKQAFEIIEANTGRAIVPCDTLKKQKILMDEVKEEDKNLREKPPPMIIVRARGKNDRLGYNTALAHARNSREEAQRQLSLQIQNYNKAAEAYKKGCPGVAAYYSQVARLHTRNIDAAHAAAASAFVEAQSWDSEESLDLHNLFVSEALTALDEFLEYHLDKLMRNNKRSSTIYIVTGRGARSNRGTSKIKPAVSQKLNSRNIKFTEDNPGCLKVTLYRKNGTTYLKN